jgi:hypothetical protein
LKKEIEETLQNGKTTHIHESAEIILWKWLYCQKQSIDSKESPSKFQCHYSKK